MTNFSLRFKEGLATLGVIHALQQHPFLFQPFMCSRAEPLTSNDLDLTKLNYICIGTSISLYFILDNKTAVSLQEILMFETGLNNCSSITHLVFQLGKTCANTIAIPVAQSYEQFQADMDFAILNSPVHLPPSTMDVLPEHALLLVPNWPLEHPRPCSYSTT
uniref:Uncharacterized protein n=1 Tax=Paramormyrops kingsleyae TaxID=1676925 RepID=A0A3B3SRT1_9TELE